jgi:predicted N-acetyltransferase YhbS
MLKIRTMDSDDAEFVIEITGKEGWGYETDDFQRMMFYEPNANFVALKDGTRCGMITTVNYGRMGWIGNVVVGSEFRGEDIGKALVTQAIGYMKARGVRSVKLNSYLDSREFYSKMGFEVEGYCSVFSNPADWKSPGKSGKGGLPGIRKLESGDISQVISLDRMLFGFNRSRFLKRMNDDFPGIAHISKNVSSERVEGFIMGADSASMGEMGPWVCDPDIETDIAKSLLLASVGELSSNDFSLVVPDDNKRSASILKDLGLKEEYKVAVMRLGEEAEYSQPGGIFAQGSLAQG